MIKFYRHPKLDKSEVTTYVNKDGDRIEIAPFFLYEITLSKYIVDDKQRRYEQLDSKFVKSNKEVPDKCDIKYFPNKKKLQYCIVKNFTMVGATKEYIMNNNFPIWELNKKKHEKRKSSLQRRKVHKLRR